MQQQKYTTVSQAIRRVRMKVGYPALIAMVLIMSTAIYFLAAFEGSIPFTILSIILMFSSFGAFGAIMTYFGDKWKTWAYKHVDDVIEFRERAYNNRFSVNIYPSKWHLSIKKERLKAFNIVRERIKNNTLIVPLDDDYSIPRRLEIKRSVFYYLIPLAFCIWACYKTTGRLLHGSSAELVIDIILALLSSAGILFLLIKLIMHPILVIIFEEGIWSKKTGFQSWNMVASWGFDDTTVSNQNGSHITTDLYILFKSESGLKKKKRTIKHNINYLNKNADTIEKTIKVHYHRYSFQPTDRMKISQLTEQKSCNKLQM